MAIEADSMLLAEFGDEPGEGCFLGFHYPASIHRETPVLNVSGSITAPA